jgi:hypothetical protein
MYMAVLFLITAGSLAMYKYLSKDMLFLYGAMASGGLFLFSLLLRFAVLGCKKNNYRTRRQRSYQKVASKLNRELFRQRGFRVNVGNSGDWLEFTDRFPQKKAK